MKKNNSKVTLICSECLSRNYSTTKSQSNTERLILNKFCKKCNKKTEHKESK